MAQHNEIGRIGEDIATKWLISVGIEIIERNYRKKWGEIDIVARGTDRLLHFVEVKTVSYETKGELDWAVAHETWRPEEQVHKSKQDRLKRAIQTWLVEKKCESKFKIDILTVRLVPREKYAKVEMIENVVFE